MHEDLETAYLSIARAERMNAEENVNVFLAHDRSMDLAIGGALGVEGEDYKEWVKLDGSRDELKRFKAREQINFK